MILLLQAFLQQSGHLLFVLYDQDSHSRNRVTGYHENCLKRFFSKSSDRCVNIPEVEVADVAKGAVVARWPVTCTTNFPMALDEAHHRLFVGCRMPARLVVFNTETGKVVASPTIVEHTDDLFFDASKDRIYILGEGFIEAWQEKDPDCYERLGRYATPADGRTGLFAPDLGELFETIPHHGQQGAEILVYATK